MQELYLCSNPRSLFLSVYLITVMAVHYWKNLTLLVVASELLVNSEGHIGLCCMHVRRDEEIRLDYKAVVSLKPYL